MERITKLVVIMERWLQPGAKSTSIIQRQCTNLREACAIVYGRCVATVMFSGRPTPDTGVRCTYLTWIPKQDKSGKLLRD